MKFIISEELKDGNDRKNKSFPIDRAKMAIFVGTGRRTYYRALKERREPMKLRVLCTMEVRVTCRNAS